MKKVSKITGHILAAVYGLACIWLYYRQSIADLTVEGTIQYQSDLPLHISMIVEDGWYYSFTAYVYKFLYTICGGSTIGIAVFLGLASYGCIYITQELVCFLADWKERTGVSLWLSLALNFVMPIFIPMVGEYRYVSYQSANIWHNSTYICMKPVALLTLLCFFKLAEKYTEGLSLKEWMGFALLNILCTGIKPSFLLAFSPVMGLFLLNDLIHRKPFGRILIFGSALLPSGLVILWQNAVLFGDNTGNGIGLNPWYTFALHARYAKLAVICSTLFCLGVLFMTVKELFRDRIYRFCTIMCGVGFLEALCLVENGSRSVDGNFLWGYSFCLAVMFTACAVRFVTTLIHKNNIWMRIGTGIMAVVFLWHVYCGVYFFVHLVLGSGYWMQ